MIRINHKVPSTHVALTSFIRFVRYVLMLHRRPAIDTFYLSIDDLEDELEDVKIVGDVQACLRFATDKEVKDLYLHYEAFHVCLGPARCVFTSQSLTTLTLSHCTLNHYEHEFEPHMGTLKKLSLTWVCGSTDNFNKLISGCPSLQELFINVAGGPGLLTLTINSPSVSKLHLHLFNCHCTLNCPSLKIMDITVFGTTSLFQMSVIGVICLQEVNVGTLPWRCSSDLVKSLFRQIQNAKMFSLSCKAFEDICSIEKMEFPQNRWRCMVLHPLWNRERCRERCLEVISMLIKSSINLEELIICAGESLGNCELVCPKLYTCDSCVLPLLKTVTIYGNHGYEKWCKCQLQVIKFLLANAVVLDKLVIKLGKSKLTTIEELDLVKQVSSFSRASANVTVIFA